MMGDTIFGKKFGNFDKFGWGNPGNVKEFYYPKSLVTHKVRCLISYFP